MSIVVFPKVKKGFVPITKVASSTMIATGTQIAVGGFLLDASSFRAKHPDYELVALTRDPYKRLVSCFKFLNRVVYPNGLDLPPVHSSMNLSNVDVYKWEWFVEDVCQVKDENCNMFFKSQVAQLQNYGAEKAKTYDISHIRELADILQLPELRTRNVTEYDDRDYYADSAIRDAVAKRYAIDFDMFGYSTAKR